MAVLAARARRIAVVAAVLLGALLLGILAGALA
jgi:hypothetical protein